LKRPGAAGLILTGLALGLVLGERRRPLRPAPADPDGHDLRNAVIAVLSAATVTLIQTPLVEPLARTVERRGWGLARQGGGPEWARTAVAVLLMDYTLYHWHVLTHRTPWLWRLHATHHSDAHLTASTALRFHFLEMAASVPYRALQVAVLGASPAALRLWQGLTLAAILFHHSNLRLPVHLERPIGWLLATPRMHGIHHSKLKSERDSNFSSGLSVWDRLHGTLRQDVPQEQLSIGVSRVAGPPGLARALVLPFSPEARLDPGLEAVGRPVRGTA
jgi:sterol desaturase/sphingolipid hydroxylase (fatty acid hydroxylase superfamily)